jgi:2-dehydropantoate 2-reductase
VTGANPWPGWPSVAVVGAGAVGCFFGGMLARAGAPVTFIGRQQHVDALNHDGLVIDSATFPSKVAVKASTSLDAVIGAQLVLVCVKTLDLDQTAADLATRLAKDAIVVCMQNGVDHAERFNASSGFPAIPAVVYVGAAMPSPGRVRHNGSGRLVLGPASQSQPVADLFERAEVPCRISANIEGELWVKLIMNCAYNAQSALAQANYGRIVAQPETRRILIETVNECLAVAHASGIVLPNPDPLAAALELGTTTMTQQFSSTAQDIARGKLTEIDSLNGYVVRRGAEAGVPTPVNATLHALVKLRERAQKI